MSDEDNKPKTPADYWAERQIDRQAQAQNASLAEQQLRQLGTAASPRGLAQQSALRGEQAGVEASKYVTILKSDYEGLKQTWEQCTSLMKENESLRADSAHVLETNEKLRAELANMRVENETLKSEYLEREKRIVSLDMERMDLETENKKLRKFIAGDAPGPHWSSGPVVQVFKSEYEKLRAENEALKKRLLPKSVRITVSEGNCTDYGDQKPQLTYDEKTKSLNINKPTRRPVQVADVVLFEGKTAAIVTKVNETWASDAAPRDRGTKLETVDLFFMDSQNFGIKLAVPFSETAKSGHWSWRE